VHAASRRRDGQNVLFRFFTPSSVIHGVPSEPSLFGRLVWGARAFFGVGRPSRDKGGATSRPATVEAVVSPSCAGSLWRCPPLPLSTFTVRIDETRVLFRTRRTAVRETMSRPRPTLWEGIVLRFSLPAFSRRQCDFLL